MAKTMSRVFQIINNKFSLMPKLIIYNNKNKKIGYLRTKLFFRLSKSINVYQQNKAIQILFKIKRDNSNFLKHQYSIQNINLTTDIKNLKINHIGYRNIYKKSTYEIRADKKLYMAYERSSKITKISHLFLMIPIIGEFIDSFLILIPITFEIFYYDITNNQKTKVANIIIRSNLYKHSIQIQIHDKNTNHDIIYLAFGILLYF
jgi:hypothetical protein